MDKVEGSIGIKTCNRSIRVMLRGLFGDVLNKIIDCLAVVIALFFLLPVCVFSFFILFSFTIINFAYKRIEKYL